MKEISVIKGYIKNKPIENFPLDIVILAAIVISFCIAAAIPATINENIKNIFIDIQFKIRGERQIEDDILIVFIGDEDIQVLNNNQWPITRDYYSYITYALNSLGTKAIGFDILFNGTTFIQHFSFSRIILKSMLFMIV